MTTKKNFKVSMLFTFFAISNVTASTASNINVDGDGNVVGGTFSGPVTMIYPPEREPEREINSGVLVYERYGNRIEMSFGLSDLHGSQEFDLSRCDSASRCLSISIGYPETIAYTEGKTKVWIVPQYMREEGAFSRIRGEWSSQIGIFWTWGGWTQLERYSYLVNKNFTDINLYTARTIAKDQEVYGYATDLLAFGSLLANAHKAADCMKYFSLKFR